jgi:hypothetical protein
MNEIYKTFEKRINELRNLDINVMDVKNEVYSSHLYAGEYNFWDAFLLDTDVINNTAIYKLDGIDIYKFKFKKPSNKYLTSCRDEIIETLEKLNDKIKHNTGCNDVRDFSATIVKSKEYIIKLDDEFNLSSSTLKFISSKALTELFNEMIPIVRDISEKAEGNMKVKCIYKFDKISKSNIRYTVTDETFTFHLNNSINHIVPFKSELEIIQYVPIDYRYTVPNEHKEYSSSKMLHMNIHYKLDRVEIN